MQAHKVARRRRRPCACHGSRSTGCWAASKATPPFGSSSSASALCVIEFLRTMVHGPSDPCGEIMAQWTDDPFAERRRWLCRPRNVYTKAGGGASASSSSAACAEACDRRENKQVMRIERRFGGSRSRWMLVWHSADAAAPQIWRVLRQKEMTMGAARKAASTSIRCRQPGSGGGHLLRRMGFLLVVLRMKTWKP